MKNICVFTGTRAEYGLLSNLVIKLEEEKRVNLTLLVSGTHLEKDFGKTIDEINKTFKGKIKKISLPFHKGISIASLTAIALTKYSTYLEKHNFDLVFLLGDRYESFAMASAAFLLRIQIAHIHGGETTLGAFDNELRHSITHMSKFHFVSNHEHLKKVIELGATKENCLISGPMVIDNLNSSEEITKTYFERETGYVFGKKNILISFHSETLCKDYGLTKLDNLLIVLNNILNEGLIDLNILVTYPNADTGGELIIKKIKDFSNIQNEKVWLFPSLGHKLYIHALKKFDCLIGNSSSGIIEAPLVGIPVLNIGNRQKGRVTFGEVLNISGDKTEINKSLTKILIESRPSNSPQNFVQSKSPSKLIIDFLIDKYDLGC